MSLPLHIGEEQDEQCRSKDACLAKTRRDFKRLCEFPTHRYFNLHTLMEAFYDVHYLWWYANPEQKVHMRGWLMVSKAFTRSTNMMWSC